MAKRILVVDDEKSMRDTLKIMLEKEGFEVDSAENGAEALKMFENDNYDLIITDLKMPEVDGIKLIETLNSMGSDTSIIIMTAYASKEQAIKALNLGATFFIEKPFKKPELMNFINRSIKMEDLIRENRELKANISQSSGLDKIIGTSKEISTVRELLRKVAKTESTVLITGESGTGKEVVARALHAVSYRTDGKFVAINCGAIPIELLESELFGHIKGSFTGAVKDKVGLMEMANGGTFFLDEVGNTAPSIQVKILRAIQEREILPVGGQTPKIIDIRLIAATNENLEEAINRGGFRKDLYYRLNVINIHIPPLRKRREDIELLFMHFLRLKDQAGKIDYDSVPKDLVEVLTNYEWPGNIRELENLVERLLALSTKGKISVNLLPDHIKKPEQKQLVSDSDFHIPCMDDIEKSYIHWVLTQQGGQKQKAAEILGIGRSTLDRKIEKYGLDV
ncbi:sigma-54-dependent transcriptional regulator [Candidatus Latescibacterota bacterium]